MTTDTRPFLPEPDPVQAKKPQARRTLALWCVLILMFLGIWQFLQPSETAQHRARRAPTTQLAPCDSNDGPTFWGVTTTLVPVGVTFLLFFWFFRAYGASQKFSRLQEPGLVALAERRIPLAIEIFEKVLATNKNKPAYAAVARLNIGLAQLEAGELGPAIASLAQVERTLGLPRASGARLRAGQELAFVHALTGDLDTAQRWAEDARKRLSATYDARVYSASRLRLAEAVIPIRRGDAAAAATDLEKSWMVMRGSLDGNSMRVAEVIRAFAEVGGGLRQYNVVQERLIRVEPVLGNEFAFLGAGWPEMRSFLDAHRLVKSAPPAA